MATLGQHESLRGDVSRLRWIGAKAPNLVEQMLGFEAGRLAAGYQIALLKAPLRPNHLIFSGLTLRSGGREGLPLADPAADKLRTRVHERMLLDYGTASVDKMRDKLASDKRNLLGEDRIVKILPVTPHQGANPEREYPAGGGAPQFTLTDKHDFLIAVEVDANAVARTAAGWSVPIGHGAPYDGRAALMRYMTSA